MTYLHINILESNDEISQKILKALLPEVTKYFNKAFNQCKKEITTIVSNAIVGSPEYQSIMSGKLKYEFGLPDSASRLSSILSFWKYLDIQYDKPKIVKNQINSYFTLSMIRADYSDVLSSAAAVFKTEKGTDLEWLRWLLLFGDKVIIKDYSVEIGPNPRSRTGNAVMVGNTKGRWSVPPEFSGTPQNNWITRAIDSVDSSINELLNKCLKV
jgi:hypothetical protein